MKLIDYGVRDDERKYIEEWSKENDIEVKIVQELLTPETVELANGFDALLHTNNCHMIRLSLTR